MKIENSYIKKMKTKYINKIYNKKKKEYINLLDKIGSDILLEISSYLDVKDIINLSLVSKNFYYIFYYVLKKIYNKNNIYDLLHDYYEIILISSENQKYFKNKSYMFFNSIFEDDGYFFISKIYLNEIGNCDFLPNKGYLKFYIGENINESIKFKNNNLPSFLVDLYKEYFNNIYYAKIVYKNKINNNNKNLIYRNRKYISIRKNKTLDLSYVRDLYINSNNIKKEKKYPYKFSENYLFGPETYYEDKPIEILKKFLNYNQKNNEELILIATFDPKLIFPYNKITEEMISFFIMKSDLEKLKNIKTDKYVFTDVYVVYRSRKIKHT